MSVLRTQHSEKQVGKGDSRRDNFPIFRANFPNLKSDRTPYGKVRLNKATRTVITYK